MGMKRGVEQRMHAAIDEVSETTQQLIAGGVDPIEASKAAAIMTKAAVSENLRRRWAGLNAAGITQTLSREGDQPRLN